MEFRHQTASRRLRSLAAAALLLLPAAATVAQQSDSFARPSRPTEIVDPAAAPRRARAFARSHEAGAAQQSAASLLSAAHAQHTAMVSAQATSLTTGWIQVGPGQVQSQRYGLVTGRVTALALDPADAINNTLYVGTSGGGVWKSTNATSTSPTFSPISDSIGASLSIGALSVQPGGTGVILAGSGDPNDALDSYYGQGILRSTNNGTSWSVIQTAFAQSFVGEGFAGFAWHSSVPSIVAAAVSSAAEATSVGASRYPGVRGLYYSVNGGAVWTLATIMDGSTVVQNRVTNYVNFRGNAATSVVWNPIRRKFYAAIRSHGYYESTDSVTWTRLANQPGTGLSTTNCPARPDDYGLASCPIFRGTLAVQANTGDMFAITVDANNKSVGLWQDVCNRSGSNCSNSAPTWGTKIDTSGVEDNGSIPAGDYNLTLAAVPAATALSTTDTLLFLGAGDLYRCSLAGGCTLRNTTNATTGCSAPAGVAPAQHALAWGTNLANAATPTIFLGNDGGLWRSPDGVRQQAAVCSADDATHFDNLNGSLGSLAEVASLSSHPTDASVVLAALGANGTAASTTAAQASAQSPWTQLSAAESGTVNIDQGNGQNWLLQSGSGVALRTCTYGTQCTAADFAGIASIGYSQVNGDNALTDPPALLDPALNTNVLVGTCRVWRGPSTGLAAWSTSNAISTAMFGLLTNGVCPAGSSMIRSLAAGGTTQLSSSAQNSGSPVLYAGLSGATNGGAAAAGHIFTTSAAGVAGSSTAWTDLTSNPVTNDTSNRFNAAGFDVSSIAVDRSDSTGRTIYATIQGFGVPHIYRSTNGGSTWLNISANLPNAPANAVTVDPNDPRVVYVGMDTGVYVASDVTTCVAVVSGATGACWSVYGTALPGAPITALSATQGISVPGTTQAGALRAGTYGRGIWQIPLLTAGQASAPSTTFSPSSLTFTSQRAGTTSAAQTVTLKNTGTAALVISGVKVTDSFLETDTCAGTTVTVNATCTLQVSFAPTVAGSIAGSVQVVANVPGGYASLALSGTATGVSKLVVSPASISFGDLAVNAISPPQTVTFRNAGDAPATLSTVALIGPYNSTTNTCGTTLAAGATCTVSVAFAPNAVGLLSGSVALSDANGTATATFAGNGTGSSKIVYSASSVDFGNGAVGTIASGMNFTFSNTGTANAFFEPPVLVGDFFLYSDSCPGNMVPPGATCTLQIFFIPTGTGRRTGTLTITDSTGAHVIPLTGLGNLPTNITVTPRLTFASTNVNSVSATQTITISNSGRIAFFGVTQVDGDFGIQSSTCGQYVVNSSCTLTVLFSPTADGPRTGYVKILLDGTSYYTLLSGTAVGTPKVAITPSALDFGDVGVGSLSEPQIVQISNTGTAALALQSQTISGDFTITGNTCGTSLAVKTSCAVTIVFKPASAGARTGMISLVDALGTHTVSLTGIGSGSASVGVNPASLNFGTVSLGASASKSVTVLNSGTADIGLLTPVTSGDFRVTSTTCGSRLAPGADCSVSIVFTPAADGGRTGTLTVADTAASHTVVLTGIGKGAATVALTPNTVIFGNTAVSTVTAAQTITATNSGTASATLNTPAVSGDFKIASTTCTSTLAAGASCTLAVTFAPTASGFRSGILSLAEADSTHSVALQGTGTAGVLTLSPTSVDFYDTTLNTTTIARTVALTNTGNSPLTLGTVTATDDFAVSSNCNGATLFGGSACTLSITFSPKTAGAHTGAVTISSNSNGVAGTLSTIALTGSGKGAFNVTVTPLAMDFGTQLLGSTSAVTNVTVSNTGTVSGGLGAFTVAGADFSIKANTCGATLAPQVGCTVSLVFAPTIAGVRSGTLTIASDAGTQAVTLTGTGQNGATDTLTPLSLTFTQQTVNTTSSTQLVTLSNSGDVPLTLVSAQLLSGDFTINNACTPTLPARSSCAIAVAFAPQRVGVQTGVLQIIDVQRTQRVTLSGTGLAAGGVTLTPASLTYANTGVGVVGAAQTLTLSNTTSNPVTLTGVTVNGNYGILAGAGTCSISAPVPSGGACTMDIAFLPAAAGARSGSVVVTTSSNTFTSQLTGTGIDFTFGINGGTDSATLSNGASVTYPLILRPAVNTPDPVTYACTGVPAYTRCTVTAQYADLSATSTVNVTLLTGTATAKSVRLGLLLPLLLMPLCAFSKSSRITACLLLLVFVAMTSGGCGSGKTSASSGNGGGSTGSSGGGGSTTTPSGTYTVTISATAAGVTHTVPLTLKVQ